MMDMLEWGMDRNWALVCLLPKPCGRDGCFQIPDDRRSTHNDDNSLRVRMRMYRASFRPTIGGR